MAGKRCLLKNCLNDRRKPLKAAAQIREPGGNPDPCPCLRLDHRNRLPKTARTRSGSTPASTLITALPGSSIWIDPDGATAAAIPDSVTLLGSAVRVTGTNLVCACRPTSRLPLRYSCRHWNTWFAFTPCSRATRAIEAPVTNVASTMRRFSSRVLRNRLGAGGTASTANASLTRPS
jgi:hypothetical protein